MRLLRRLLALALVLATASGMLIATATGAAAATSHPQTAEQIERLVLAEHHTARTGMPALEHWSDLRDVARAWSSEQVRTGMAHNPRFGDQVCCWERVSENVGHVGLRSQVDRLDDATVAQIVDILMDSWMNSSGHRANILQSAHDQVGIGVAVVARDTTQGRVWDVYATVNFRQWDGVSAIPGERLDGPPARSTSALCGSAGSAGFDDVRGTFHEETIDCAVHHGLASGISEDRYAPTGDLTRAQAATFVHRMLESSGHTPARARRDHFIDDNGQAHEANINALVEAGVIVTGNSLHYRPSEAITRGDLALMIGRALRGIGQLDVAGQRWFDDLGSLSSSDRALVDDLASAGVLTGIGERTFGPNHTLTRAQMASFVVRGLDAARAA